MTTLPADVHSSLSQLLSNATADARDGDADAVAGLVESIESVTINKVPDGALRERLLHGCAEVDGLVESDPEVAAEYLRSMGRLVDQAEPS